MPLPHPATARIRRSSLALAAMMAMGAGPTVQAASLEWKGSTTGLTGGTNQTWDTNTTANWWDGAATINWPALLGTDDDAVFGGTAGTVTITTATANDITFNTTGYTLTGGTLTLNGTTPTITTGASIDAIIASKISGAAGLTKAGDGILTLSGANDYTGVTTISAGILKAGNAAALGSATNGTTVSSGASLDVNALNLGAEVVTISGTGVGGNGAIINTGAQQTQAFRFITLGGNATIGGPNRWDIRNNSTATLDLGGFTLTKTGTNYIAVVGTTVTNPGNIIINQGELNLSTSTNLGGSAANSITINNGGTLGMYQSSSAHAWTLNLNTGSTLRGENGTAVQNIWAGAVNANGNFTLRAEESHNITISGSISGSGNLEKTGKGTGYLTADNSSWSGGITITAGALRVEHANALGSTTLITTGTDPANDAALALGNGIATGLGKTLKIAADGNNYGALTSAASNSGTAEWKGAVTIDALTGARIGSQGGNLLVSGLIGETTAGSELFIRTVETGAPASVTLSNNNTYSGATMIGSGIVSVGTIGNSGFNSPLGTNGTIRLGLAGATVSGARLTYTGSGEITNKVIDLVGTTGGIAIDHSGTNLLKFSSSFAATGAGAKTLTLQGNNTGTGEIAGAIVDNTATNRTSLIKDGSNTWVLSGTNSYTGATTVRSGTLRLDYTTNNTTKLSDTTSALTMSGGTLDLYGGSHIEVVTSTSLTGNTHSFIKRTNAPDPAPAATSVLRMNAITRNGGSSIDFAAGGIADTDTSNTRGILGGWATVAGTDWATSATTAADTLITALGTYTLTSVAGNTAANYLDNNISVDSNQAPAAVITPNSLRFNDGTLATPRTLTLATGNNIVSSGGILVTSNVGNNLSKITGGTLTLPTAGGNLMLHQNNTANKLLIESIIANNTGTLSILKTGAGEAELAGLDTYTGGLIVNGGTLTLSGNRSGSNAMGAINVGMTAGSNATLNISNGTYAMAGRSLLVGGAQGTPITATVNQSNGAVTFTSGNGILLGNAGTTATTGDYNLSGGSITTNFAAASTNRGILIGTNNSSKSTFTLSGTGSLNLTGGGFNTTLQIGRYDSDADNTTAKFLQTGTNSTATIGSLSMGGNADTGSDGSAVLELTAGTFTAATFDRLAGGARNNNTIIIGGTANVTLPAFPTVRGVGATATLIFDGGTLKPTADSTAYISGLTAAYIQDGGAKFDTNTKNITVSQNLLTDPVSLGGGLTKLGTGTLVLSGTNTYTGNTLFGTAVNTSTGVLRLANSSALGSGKLVINNGNTDTGVVELTGGINVANNIDFFGRGNSTLAIIRNVSGNNELSGVLTGSFNGNGYNIYSDAGTLTISNKITTVTSGRVLNLRGAGAITVSGLVENGTGSMSVRTLDAGTYTLTGDNSYTGYTEVNAGVLNVRHANALGTTAGTTTVSSGATLQLQGGVNFAAETLSLTGNGVSSAGSLRSISGDNTWNGAINAGVSAATRVQSDANKLTLAGTITLSTTAGDEFVLQGDGAIDVTGKVTGASIVTSSSQGTGIRTLSNAANDYAGETTVNGGFLQAGVNNALPYGAGKGNLVLNGGASAAGVFNLNGYDVNTNGLSGTTGAFVGRVVNNANGTTKTLTVGNGNATASYAGVLADNNNSGTGILALEKTGSGTQTLSGTNTYTGATQVNGGVLNVSGSLASGSAVKVGGALATANATLVGAGTINGSVTVATDGGGNAGVFNPGTLAATVASSVGKTIIGNGLTFESQAIFAWNLKAEKETATVGAVRGTDYDAVDITGNLNVHVADTDPSGGIIPTPAQDSIFRVVVDNTFDFSTTFWQAARTWSDIFSITSGTTSGWANNTAAGVFTYDLTTNAYTTKDVSSYGTFTISGTSLNWTAVPEPTSALAGLLLGAGLLRRRRRA